MQMESHQFLSDDLLVEIVARSSSAATIIRCAAISKPLRRRILHPAFLIRRRLPRGVIPAGDADDEGGGDLHRFIIPSLLLGVYHRARDDPCSPLAFAPSAGGAGARIAASLALVPPAAAAAAAPPIGDHGGGGGACVLGSYQPLSSRRSLVVLRRRCKIVSHQGRRHRHDGASRHGGELTVCNPASGVSWVLPPHEVFDQTLVLLDVVNHHNDGVRARTSFKLLAAHLPESSPRMLIVQLFSSDERAWAPPLACSIPHDCDLHSPAKPAVLRGAVYWLCLTHSRHRILKWERRGHGHGHGHGDIAQPKASLMNLPPSCESGVHDISLAVSPAAATLSLVVLTRDHVAVWVRSRRNASSWKKRHVIREDSIARPVDLRNGWLGRITGLEWFCEGSGTLFLEGNDGAVLLDPRSRAVNKVEMVSRWSEFCPYEVDLISYMLYVMKAF